MTLKCDAGGLFQVLPSGFEYRSDFLLHEEERELLREVDHVQFNRVEMRGAVARRRTAHYGYTYGYERRQAAAGVPIPEFLMSIRERVASWARLDPEAFAEALTTEYPEGGRRLAGIGMRRCSRTWPGSRSVLHAA